jgi:hypothetical protein
MLRKEIFKRAFWILFAVGVLNLIATKLYLHLEFWWIDVILHFLGGLTVTLFALWFCAGKFNLKNWSQIKILLVALFAAILVGFLWECYELYFGITFLSDGWHYFADTGSDLLMDLVGGIFGFLWTTHLLKKFQ